MYVTFYGAVREVTGSMHLLGTTEDRVLLDCGMFQGHRKESEAKNRILPLDPSIVANVVLSHAHIDHSGRIPFLAKDRFHGRVISTRATADAAALLLLDSAHIQESDAAYLNYKLVRNYLYEVRQSRRTKKVSEAEKKRVKKLLKDKNNHLKVDQINELAAEHHLAVVEPLYTIEDVNRTLGIFEGYPYNTSIAVGRGMECTFYDAGHILGSAVSIVRAKENGRTYTIGYTGDLGRFDKPILKDPSLNFAEQDRDLDLLIMESTYGQRRHGPVANLKDELRDVLLDNEKNGGTVVIPSFAYGRTQELIYLLNELYRDGEVPRIPVYVDSPLATKLTRVFGEHPEVYDRDAVENFLEKGRNPFSFPQMTFVGSVEESMAAMRDTAPHIVLAASGMCEAGRVLHHLRYKMHNPANTILIVGYMAAHTLGRRILEQGSAYEQSGRKGDPPIMRLLGKTYPLKAHVKELEGFSAHADVEELSRFLRESNLRIKKIVLVHGEEEQSLGLERRLKQDGFDAYVPCPGETLVLKPS